MMRSVTLSPTEGPLSARRILVLRRRCEAAKFKWMRWRQAGLKARHQPFEFQPAICRAARLKTNFVPSCPRGKEKSSVNLCPSVSTITQN